MFALLSWIRKQYEERQSAKELEARQTEMRIQREQRDAQQTQTLLLSLHELQRTMDPLIATQVYNSRFCPLISRLPEEILLCILDFLCDDPVALHCLRIVSMVFYRLLNRQAVIWRDEWYRPVLFSTRGNAFYLHNVSRLQFRRLLQREGRCNKCMRWNSAGERPLFDDCQFQQDCRQWPNSRYEWPPYFKLDCYACRSRHDICQFPSAYLRLSRYPVKSLCLGQQGSVQLCEHVQIYWASIQGHIDDWRQRQRQPRVIDWQACLNSFKIECQHASHNTCCTTSEGPTWPTARLGTNSSADIVILVLEWQPHSRIGELSLTTDGRIPAAKLRARFQMLQRLGPADDLCPPCRPGALPEMGFFGSSSRFGPFVYYKRGENDEMGLPSALFPPLPSQSCIAWRHRYGLGFNGKKLDIRPHYPKDVGGTGISSQCLVVSYKKDIMICKTAAIADSTVKIVPTDHWLDAMDTRTYPCPRASHIRPQCREVTCVNYYQRRKDWYGCYDWLRCDDPN
jgi:hypothetical protein